MSSFLLIFSTSNRSCDSRVIGQYSRLVDVLVQLAEEESFCCSKGGDQIAKDIDSYYSSCSIQDEWIYPDSHNNHKYIVRRIH